MAGLSPAELLESLTSRLADGREVTLEQLQNVETLRAAEVEISVPDGRSVRLPDQRPRRDVPRRAR